MFGATEGTRTLDLTITNRLLCRLSYGGILPHCHFTILLAASFLNYNASTVMLIYPSDSRLYHITNIAELALVPSVRIELTKPYWADSRLDCHTGVLLPAVFSEKK